MTLIAKDEQKIQEIIDAYPDLFSRTSRWYDQEQDEIGAILMYGLMGEVIWGKTAVQQQIEEIWDKEHGALSKVGYFLAASLLQEGYAL